MEVEALTDHPMHHSGDQVPALVMPDAEFLAIFERGGFPADGFPHRAHLRMAWLYVTSLGSEKAIDKAASGIRNLAKHNGVPNLYHDTITRAWVYAVAVAIGHSSSTTFSDFIEEHPRLLDKHLLLEHYTKGVLTSPEARAAWVAPDISPIPGAPTQSL
jgi:hypothetical protein